MEWTTPKKSQVDNGTQKNLIMLVNLLASYKKSIRSDHMYIKIHYDPNRIFNLHKSSFRKEGHILSQLQLLICRKNNNSIYEDRSKIKTFHGTL